MFGAIAEARGMRDANQVKTFFFHHVFATFALLLCFVCLLLLVCFLVAVRGGRAGARAHGARLLAEAADPAAAALVLLLVHVQLDRRHLQRVARLVLVQRRVGHHREAARRVLGDREPRRVGARDRDRALEARALRS